MPEADFTEEYLDKMVTIFNIDKRIKLIIVGSDRLGVVNRKYSNLIGEKIVFVKYEVNLGALYQICDIYVNPPRDGGGYSLAEAMFYGLPIISFVNSYSGKGWLGEKKCVKTYDEYILKIKKILLDKEYCINESAYVIKSMEENSFKANLNEIFRIIEYKKELI